LTLASARGTEFTVDRICRRALQLCGVMESGQGAAGGTSDFEMARDFLDTIIDSLQAEGVQARAVRFDEVTLTAGTSTYNMDAEVIDVIGDAMYIPAGQTVSAAAGETIVSPIDRESWQTISSKSSEGTPTMYWANKQPAQIQIRLWPIPDEAGTIRFQVHQLFTDALDGQYTVELRQYWTNYLIWALAHHLAMAKALPMNRVQWLFTHSQLQKERARAYSNQNTNNLMVVSHETGWR